MSITAAKGFAASAVHCGIRKQDRLDLALVRSLVPATGAGMFTANRMQAAPVLVSREHLERAQPQAIVANSGIANAATGERGLRDARSSAAETAASLGLEPQQVLVLSTGVIGAPLPLDNLLAGVRAAARTLSPAGGAAAADGLRERLEDAYAGSAVVRVLPDGVAPELARVQHTDAAEVALFEDRATGRAIVVCALDNLGKGAAGQAVQNANLALGLEETAGLRLTGVLV